MESIKELLSIQLDTRASLLLVAAIALLFVLLSKVSRRRDKLNSNKFLEQHPDAAILYVYAEDLPDNFAEIDCAQGTVSEVFESKAVPGSCMGKGVLCYVLPGHADLNVTILWVKDLYLVKRRYRFQVHFTFDAEPGRAYAAVFHTKDQQAKLIPVEDALKK